MKRVNASKREILSGVVWLALGLFGLFSSLRLGIGNVREPGSGFVLFYASILFVGCIVLMLFLSYFNRQESAPVESWRSLCRRKVLVVVGASILYLLLFEKLGYLLATFALMLVLFGLGRLRLWVLLSCAGATVAGSYFIFHSLLKVPLPKGMLGMLGLWGF
jgi:putative tricarboxylic transport membrane protein